MAKRLSIDARIAKLQAQKDKAAKKDELRKQIKTAREQLKKL